MCLDRFPQILAFMDVKIKDGHAFSVPNMRSQWFGWDVKISSDFEQVADCVREAYVHVLNCARDAAGKVTVSFTKTGTSGYGKCHCVAIGKGAAHTAEQNGETSDEYQGTCTPDEMPWLYMPTILTCTQAPGPQARPLPSSTVRDVRSCDLGRRQADDPGDLGHRQQTGQDRGR